MYQYVSICIQVYPYVSICIRIRSHNNGQIDFTSRLEQKKRMRPMSKV